MNDVTGTLILQASAVYLNGRALLIEGGSGSGKSSLALALIEGGGQLIGDDGVTLTRAQIDTHDALIASPPPNIAGLLEVRGIGLVTMPLAPPAPVALILSLGQPGERMPENIPLRDILGTKVPALPFTPGSIAPAQRARIALSLHGLTFD